MHNSIFSSFIRKSISGIALLALLTLTIGAGSVTSVHASLPAEQPLQPAQLLSNGQFVNGPNAAGFNVETYLQANAPHLLPYARAIYERAEYYSINPRIYLALLEVRSGLISNPAPVQLENPFGLPEAGFISQLDAISEQMMAAYYQHLYIYSPLPVSARTLPEIDFGAKTLLIAPGTNAATYALIAGLAAMQQPHLETALDASDPDGFYQTYLKMFSGDDPLDESNHIYLPGEPGYAPAPDNYLQVPYSRGVLWRFGGVHNASGSATFTDASSLDFYPWPIAWGDDTSTDYVVASAAGTPNKISECLIRIAHTDGWETSYYHLEGIPTLTGKVNQNDVIGVIANTLSEAICSGGSSTGPHVHFSLRRNGAYVSIDGTPLSGWYVHAGRYSYDTDPNYMWLEKSGQKKYAYSDTLLSEGTPLPPSVLSSVVDTSNADLSVVKFTVTFSQSVSGVDATDFSLVSTGITGPVITTITGTGATRSVTIDPGSGVGTLRLDVLDNDTIIGDSLLPLGNWGLANGGFTAGETAVVDPYPGTFLKTTPTNGSTGRSSLTIAWGASKNAASYEYCYDDSDDNACTGWVSTNSATSKILNGLTNGLTYYWQVRAQNTAGLTYANGAETAFWSFTVNDNVPLVTSIVRSDPDPVLTTTLHFSVTFSENVTGVDPTDFILTTSGIAGAVITDVFCVGSTCTISANAGYGTGTIRLDLVDDDTILGAGDVPLGGLGLGNGSFNTGESYSVRHSLDTAGVFRPSNGALYLKNTNYSGYADIQINYGVGGDYPVVGDWNGDGSSTIGVYRDGAFFLRNSNSIGFADLVVYFGAPGDQPVAGDWDGDGIDTIGVYRSSIGTFFLRNSNTAGDPEMVFALGVTDDVGIAGDWDGDDIDSTGVFRPSNGALYLKNANTTGFADIQINYGLPGDWPVTGDWDQDGIDTIGIFRGGTFMLRNSNTIGYADLYFGLGVAGDMPIAGNWTGTP